MHYTTAIFSSIYRLECISQRFIPKPVDGALHPHEQRFAKKASSDFEKDLYKPMNNSVFGKTLENLRNRVSVKLVRANEEDELRRLTPPAQHSPGPTSLMTIWQ